jgi:hypothetical protein
VDIQIVVFWVVEVCDLAGGYQHLEEHAACTFKVHHFDPEDESSVYF